MAVIGSFGSDPVGGDHDEGVSDSLSSLAGAHSMRGFRRAVKRPGSGGAGPVSGTTRAPAGSGSRAGVGMRAPGKAPGGGGITPRSPMRAAPHLASGGRIDKPSRLGYGSLGRMP
jgi:hypothetical protein